MAAWARTCAAQIFFNPAGCRPVHTGASITTCMQGIGNHAAPHVARRNPARTGSPNPAASTFPSPAASTPTPDPRRASMPTSDPRRLHADAGPPPPPRLYTAHRRQVRRCSRRLHAVHSNRARARFPDAASLLDAAGKQNDAVPDQQPPRRSCPPPIPYSGAPGTAVVYVGILSEGKVTYFILIICSCRYHVLTTYCGNFRLGWMSTETYTVPWRSGFLWPTNSHLGRELGLVALIWTLC